MSLEENKTLIRRLYDEGINRHDAGAAAEFYAVDAKNHGQVVGRAGMKAVFEALFSTFRDFNFRIEQSTAEGDRVVCKVTMSGTHAGTPTLPHAFSGMLNGVAPTGKPVRVLQFHSFRIGGGQILEHAAVRDDIGMLLQLGIVKQPG
jgi:predicted ester cyclase